MNENSFVKMESKVMDSLSVWKFQFINLNSIPQQLQEVAKFHKRNFNGRFASTRGTLFMVFFGKMFVAKRIPGTLISFSDLNQPSLQSKEYRFFSSKGNFFLKRNIYFNKVLN